MNDLHTLLSAFPALQSSPLVLALVNLAVLAYHLITHDKHRKAPSRTRGPASRSFSPKDLYTPWNGAWVASQTRFLREILQGSASAKAGRASFLAEVKHAQADLEFLIKSYPGHEKADELREHLFKLDQICRALGTPPVAVENTSAIQ